MVVNRAGDGDDGNGNEGEGGHQREEDGGLLLEAEDRNCGFQAGGFSKLSAHLVEAVVAHCESIIVYKSIEKVQVDINGLGVKRQLQALCNVYSLSLLCKHLGDFLSTNCITPKQGTLANERLRALYSQVQQNDMALVDAFNDIDHSLGFVLGYYDGNVYPKLYEEARKDLNDSIVPDGYHEYVRPLLKQYIGTSRL